MASLNGFKRINFALHLYYKQMGRTNYTNNDGKGKFIQFTEENELGEDEIDDELNKNASNCAYVDFDDEFPLETTEEKDEKLDDDTVRQKIFDVINICYKYGYPKNELSLHQFTVDTICNKITEWIHNDIKYV
eukprot:499526_1